HPGDLPPADSRGRRHRPRRLLAGDGGRKAGQGAEEEQGEASLSLSWPSMVSGGAGSPGWRVTGRARKALSRPRKELFRGSKELFWVGKELFRAGKDLFGLRKELSWAGKELFRGGKELFWVGKELFQAGKDLFGLRKE